MFFSMKNSLQHSVFGLSVFLLHFRSKIVLFMAEKKSVGVQGYLPVSDNTVS